MIRRVRHSILIAMALCISQAAHGGTDAGHYVQIVSAVRALPGPGCSSVGSGLGLGDGLYITAGHVLLDRDDLTGACRIDAAAAEKLESHEDLFRVDVTDDTGLPRAAKIVARGKRSPGATLNFKGSTDYALLRVGAPVRSAPRLDPCPGTPTPGQSVYIVLPTQRVLATVAKTPTPKSGDDAAYVDLDSVVPNGVSGAGVIDASRGCVMGVISHRFPEPQPSVTRITPVSLFANDWAQARGD